MGSFDYTCGFSHLPIHAGDKVRYLLLTASPYADGRACTAEDMWFPRTYPLRAIYNDYGSVEKVETGLAQQLWMDGFQIDLVSQGVGDNTCHDVPTSKDMSFEALLEAIVESRVLVSRNIERNDPSLDKLFKRPKLPKGVPTMQRVRKALQKAGHTISSGMMDAGYMVNKLQHGIIRVRWTGAGQGTYGKDAEALTKVLPCFSEYATVVKLGGGSYASAAELLVFVRPGVDGFHYGPRDRKKSLLVDHLMVREDVWQGLLDMPASIGYKGETVTAGDHCRAVRKLYQKSLKVCETPRMGSFDNNDNRLYRLVHSEFENPAIMAAHNRVPFTVGLGTHWRLLVEQKLSVDHPIFESIGEMVHVMKVLFPIRYGWMPSNSTGPQFGDWEQHVKFHNLLRWISIEKAEKERAKG